MKKTLKLSKRLLLILCSMSVLILGNACGLDFDFNSNSSKEPVVEILNTKGVNNQGVLTVTGEAKNTGTVNINRLVITVTFYNDAKEEVASQKVTSEDILLPDESYNFKVNCLKKEASGYEILWEATSNG